MTNIQSWQWTTFIAFITLSMLSACNVVQSNDPSVKPVKEYTTFMELAHSSLADIPKPDAWKKVAPEVKSITIESSADGSSQPALFYDSGSDREKPLLLVLHSWSANYMQHFSIPYGVWAVKNDWVFIHPNFRGDFNKPEATASELAMQDILDALQYAKDHARIDDSRIYLAGFSGGGMMTLIMVGRHPELWTAAVAWVPIYDLAAWYDNRRHSNLHYASDIEQSCGGPPLPGTEAARECLKRSPKKYLDNARNRDVRVYIATGIEDEFVPPDHTLRAFNDLADEEDRFTEEEITEIVDQRTIHAKLADDYSDSLYEAADKKVLLERTSGNVTLKIFEGGHDVVYNAGLMWLSKHNR